MLFHQLDSPWTLSDSWSPTTISLLRYDLVIFPLTYNYLIISCAIFFLVFSVLLPFRTLPCNASNRRGLVYGERTINVSWIMIMSKNKNWILYYRLKGTTVYVQKSCHKSIINQRKFIIYSCVLKIDVDIGSLYYILKLVYRVKCKPVIYLWWSLCLSIRCIYWQKIIWSNQNKQTMSATVDWTSVKLASWLPVKEPDTCGKPICRADNRLISKPLLVTHMLEKIPIDITGTESNVSLQVSIWTLLSKPLDYKEYKA